MKSLTTTFAGLTLKCPIIAASSSKTNSAERNAALEQAGVGAIVLKSLFEEDIINQSQSISSSADHSEASDYMQGYLRSHALSEYINLIKQSKQTCTVPIIASINCCTAGDWVEFATLIEQAGADALELNVMSLAYEANYTDGALEQSYVDIARMVLSNVQIPVIVKLGSNLSNPTALTSRLMAQGVKGVVMFNRMYQADIDIDTMEYTAGHILSSEQDFALPLRWVGITSAAVSQVDVALSGGVQDGKDVVKSILAGAAAVEVCSALYRDGNEWIAQANETLSKWMEEHSIDSIEQMKGKMNGAEQAQKTTLARTQFIKHFGSHE